MSESAAPVSAPAPSDAPAGNSAESSQAENDGNIKKPEPASSKPKPPQYRKLKIGDQEISLSDDDIARDYSKWKGADAKFREAAEAKKSVEQFMKALQEDPESVLSDPRLPIDRKKLAEKWLIKQLESELNPPDPRDIKLSETEKKLKEYQEREEAEKKKTEEAAQTKARDERKTAISNTLSEAMKATHLSAHPESAAAVLREMAMYMRAAVERGESVTPQELVQHVHNSRFQQMYTLAHEFEGPELIDFLGEEIVNRIRKADLARLRAGRETGNSHKVDSTTESAPRSRNSTRMDGYEARRHAAKIMR